MSGRLEFVVFWLDGDGAEVGRETLLALDLTTALRLVGRRFARGAEPRDAHGFRVLSARTLEARAVRAAFAEVERSEAAGLARDAGARLEAARGGREWAALHGLEDC